jgi:isopentenyl diphosphate isomerase/L-lactate dehydrogenase-like FMN-dependent dehydrogenase
MGTTSIEDVAAAAPGARKWFQLYMWKDRDRSMALVERAAKAGFDTLVVTVDVPVAGARLRDVRNGMTIPPTLTPRTVLNAIPRPAWWFNLLTTEPLAFASLDSWSGTVADLLDTMFDPTVTYDDLAWIREQWPGKVSVKGVQTVADAVRLADAGVDAIVLSNHGGRQLDRAPVPFHLLPEVVEGRRLDVEVHLDTGIMSGQDIVAAIAHGAHFTLVGRAYLYGLMAGGRPGVDRTIEILRARSSAPCGCSALLELGGAGALDRPVPGVVRAHRELVDHHAVSRLEQLDGQYAHHAQRVGDPSERVPGPRHRPKRAPEPVPRRRCRRTARSRRPATPRPARTVSARARPQRTLRRTPGPARPSPAISSRIDQLVLRVRSVRPGPGRSCHALGMTSVSRCSPGTCSWSNVTHLAHRRRKPAARPGRCGEP